MVKSHDKSVRKFEQAAATLRDHELQQFAQETLPKLKDHLREARSLARQLGVEVDTAGVR